MALNEMLLKNSLLAIFKEMETAAMSTEDYAAKLAAAITAQIKTAEVPAQSVVVSVVGDVVVTKNPAGITVQ